MKNKDMLAVFNTIQDVIERTFPPDYLAFVYSDEKIDSQLIALQVMMECCKFAHDETSEKHSLRYFLQKEGKDSDDDYRMMIQRTLRNINNFRRAEYHFRKSNYGHDLPGLLPKEMSSIKNKIDGYEYNAFQYWEINDVHELNIVDAIFNGRISKKNFTNEKFLRYVKAYDDEITDFYKKSSDSDEQYVFSALALFTLEWKYSLDYYYLLAAEAEKNNVKEIGPIKKKCCLFGGTVRFYPEIGLVMLGIVPPELIVFESRMLVLRQHFKREFVSSTPQEFEVVERRYLNALTIVYCLLTRMTFRGVNVRDWFKQNTGIEEWADVMREYDVWECFVPNKHWTNKRIKFVKEIYARTYTNMKNPENRS